MSDWTGQDYANELTRRAPARPASTLGEIWNAEWSRSGLDTIGGVGKPYRDALGELESAIAGASGTDVTDYAFKNGINLAGAASPDERVRLLGRLADTLPEEQRKTIDPLKDVRARAASKAQKIEAEADDISATTYGLSGTATSWLAGMARITVDPVNLGAMVATAPLGGPMSGPLWKIMARQGAAAGVAQGLVEPVIEPARAELGLDAGGARAAGNIAEAAIGGGVLSGLFYGAGHAIRLARGRRPAVEPARVAEGRSDFAPGYFTPEDAAAFDQGHPVVDNRGAGLGAGAAAAPDFARGSFDIGTGAQARPTADRLAEPPRRAPDVPQFINQEDAAAFDRGHSFSDPGGSFGGADLSVEGPVRAFDLAPEDLHAAALLAERDHIIEASATAATVEARLAHVEQVADAALALEHGRPLISAAADPAVAIDMTPGKRPTYNRALSLLEYLANGRGLAPNAELQHLLDGNPVIPGFGKLIREGGLTLDHALEAAKEGRYLFDAADVAGGEAQLGQQHILDLIREEAHGNRQYPAGAEGTLTRTERALAREADRVARETARAGAETAFDARMTELRIVDPPKGLRARALQMMEKEGIADPLLAYERALVEKETLRESLRRARHTEGISIPGWDDVAADAGSAPPHGGGAQARPAERPGDAGPGAGPRADRGGARYPGEASGALGDPALKADADRALAAHGDDLDITIENPDGSTRKVSVRQALREAEEDAAAARALRDCLGDGGPGD